MSDQTPVIKADCRHYKTDRPCLPHKRRGRICGACPEYDPIDGQILVIKLDAIGDVLRTTSLLRPLKAQWPRCRVSWLTKPNAVDLLRNNGYVDEVLPFDEMALLWLATKEFDVVISPDTSETACRLAALARGRQRRGYWLDSSGSIVCSNEAARQWYLMGLDDRRKKSNQRTYQSILLEICELPQSEHPIIWNLSKAEEDFAASFAARNGLTRAIGRKIGLNTGAGGRWEWKKWTLEGFEALIQTLLANDPTAVIVLYGGPDEAERNLRLQRINAARIVNTGTDNNLRQFGALVGLCDIMVTGDTLGLHVAAALGKKIVALFGPTSSAEVELYDRGVKIAPLGMDCLCCYLNDCQVRPACMERITADTIAAAIAKL